MAGLATATVTGIMILSAKSTAEERCRPDCVTASGEPDGVGNDAVQRGKDLLPINLVAWVLAGVGAAGAAIWLISLPKTAPPKKAALAPLAFGGTMRDGGGFATVSTSF